MSVCLPRDIPAEVLLTALPYPSTFIRFEKPITLEVEKGVFGKIAAIHVCQYVSSSLLEERKNLPHPHLGVISINYLFQEGREISKRRLHAELCQGLGILEASVNMHDSDATVGFSSYDEASCWYQCITKLLSLCLYLGSSNADISY